MIVFTDALLSVVLSRYCYFMCAFIVALNAANPVALWGQVKLNLNLKVVCSPLQDDWKQIYDMILNQVHE